MLATSKPEEAKRLLKEAQADVDTRWQMYRELSSRKKFYILYKGIEISFCQIVSLTTFYQR